jgi:hypothetical protein
MQLANPILSQQTRASRNVTLSTGTRSAREMTPFVEVPRDPHRAEIVRAALASQPDDFFRHYFSGNIPSADEKLAFIERSVRLLNPLRVFQNNLYHVEIADSRDIAPGFIHLAISRRDGGTCNEWADLQQIKNEIVGPEHEAMELFPAESRLVNASNEYHLWVHSDPGFRFPIGWSQRVVFSEPVKICSGPGQPATSLDGVRPQKGIPVGTFTLTALDAGSRGV